jgi:hypothetical protein
MPKAKKLTRKASEAALAKLAERKRLAERLALRDAQTDYNNPDQVLTMPQFDRLNSLSVTQRKRIFRAGNGPPVVQLSDHRVGVRVRDNRAWQQARLRE